jgi:alpha,alpha-trehalose phosphorylase
VSTSEVRSAAERRYASRVPRARIRPPKDLYPIDPWCMRETHFAPEFLGQSETLFAVSNGYLGIRGDFEEDTLASRPGVFLNGFYETWPIVYGEEAYGFAKTGQTIVNVTDGKVIKLYVDDEPFEIEKANLLDFRRTLDFRTGTLDRQIRWETPAGKRISIHSRRMVSMVHRHLALIDYEVRCENQTAHLILSSEMMTRRQAADHADDDPRLAGGFDGRVLDPVSQRDEGRRMILCHRTHSSGITLACGMDHTLETRGRCIETTECQENRAEVTFSIDVDADQPVRLTKFLAYHFAPGDSVEELCNRVERTLSRNMAIGAEQLFEEQHEHYSDFWERGDVEIEGDPPVQQTVRFNLFQVRQATARAEGAGVPAKGLTGQGYEGHYFWDGEIYVMPYVIYSQPRVARNLLRVRYAQLDRARERARELHHEGALYPWRTINGDEASAYYAAGTAAYHINADIAYAIRKYALATLDGDFLLRGGVELLVETARMWRSLGHFSENRGGAFCINNVTGPDEYTAVVDNNRFTNMMARENLRGTARTVSLIRDHHPEDYARLVEKTGLEVSELFDWQRAADRMYLATDEKTGIHPQDDSFLDKARWDCAQIPADQHPLLLYFHPLTLYRHQVIKQADVVMAMFLLGQDFSLEEKQRNFDYYDPITTRDSSLSSCVQSIIATEVGYYDQAMEYFLEAALMDLADIGGNVIDGVHVASAGGVWMALVYGFGGMRDHDLTSLEFCPRLPAIWSRLRFPLTWRGRRIEVELTPGRASYRLLEGEALTFRHEGEELELTPEKPVAERSAICCEPDEGPSEDA